MRGLHRLAILLSTVFLRPLLVRASLHEQDNNVKLKSEIRFAMELHGFLLWASMGFLMPIGILVIRISSREEGGGSPRTKLIFYLHVFLQTISVGMVTAGGVMSMKRFENLFNNAHQRVGLALYIAVWVQALIGFFRPLRGKKERNIWYLIHWIVGTSISLVGIINIYTGLNAYHNKTAKSVSLWKLVFSLQLSLTTFFYLFQDKLHRFQNQPQSKPNSLQNLFR